MDGIKKNRKTIAAMFSSIATHYDFLNQLLSFGQAIRWRKRLIGKADLAGKELVLDLCTGSGDIALGILTDRKDFKGSVIGIDFSAPMVDIARNRVAKLGSPYPVRVEFMMGDALDLNYADDKFDMVSVGYGVRNFENTIDGLKEMFRVLKPGGEVNILEFFRAEITFLPVEVIVDTLIPWVGNLISGTNAYTYLRESTWDFYGVEEICELLSYVGFTDIQTERMTFGVAHIIRARKR